MPVLDTVVLFATADSNDKHHERAKKHLHLIGEPEVYLGAFALFEFDITLKSRGFTSEQRMEKYALLLRDHPPLTEKSPNSALPPSTWPQDSRKKQSLSISTQASQPKPFNWMGRLYPQTERLTK